MPSLPLFPLPVVLLPGMRMPLHIFEPRYRQLLRDLTAGAGQFGVIFRPETALEADLPAGTVGCRATVDEVEPLADGRSNIVVRGGDRFVLVRYLDSLAPYRVAQVAPVEDMTEPVAQVTALSLRLSELYAEAALAVAALADEHTPLPLLQPDPAHLAFSVAASVELDMERRQLILASRSPSERLRQLLSLLDTSLPSLRARVAAHQRARSNGHGPQQHA